MELHYIYLLSILVAGSVFVAHYAGLAWLAKHYQKKYGLTGNDDIYAWWCRSPRIETPFIGGLAVISLLPVVNLFVVIDHLVRGIWKAYCMIANDRGIQWRIKNDV